MAGKEAEIKKIIGIKVYFLAALLISSTLGLLIDAGWLALAATAGIVSLTTVSGPEWTLETGWNSSKGFSVIESGKGGREKVETVLKKAS